MQQQEQISAPATQLLGAEMLSLLQLLFFLTLGYAVTRTWIWSRSCTTKKALAKKIDDVDQVLEEIQGSATESDTTPAAKKGSARHSNAQNRKKVKKAKEAVVETVTHELDPVRAAPEPPQVTVAEQPQEQLQEECSQQQEMAAPVEEPPEVPTPVEPHPTPALQESSQEESSDRAMSERVVKMMAKKQERKAKKALEKKLLEEKSQEEEHSHLVAGDCVEEPGIIPGIVANVEAKSEAEAPSDDMVQTASTPSMLTHDSVQIVDTPVESSAIVHDAPVECLQTAQEDVAVMEKPVECDTLDNMETDAVSESDDVCVHSSTPEGISTPEQLLTPRGPVGEPLVWCGMPQPQIEGWMAVAVPAEFAPEGAPGVFDGLWKNSEGERIVIDHEQIEFEGGMQWVMTMTSLTTISVKVGDEEFSAELDTATQKLVWSDGDVWSCVGQTDAQQQWAAAREAEGMPPVLFDGGAMVQMAPMVMEAPMMPQNMMIPEDAKSWETCWDWSKKGWCPRGTACEWYHPPQPQRQHCKPCDVAAPFSEFVDAPFSGPIF